MDKKIPLLTVRQYKNNIRKVLLQVPPEELAIQNDWYPQARQAVREIATYYGIPVKAVCHAVAVISPGVQWVQNITGVVKVLNAVFNRVPVEEVIVVGYPQNVKKAYLIISAALNYEPFDHILSGPKVTAFARNIEFPECDQTVTLDFHAIGIASGVRFTHLGIPDIKVEVFNRVSEAYRKLAKEYGLLPNQLQAITWSHWRKGQKRRKKNDKD